MLPSRPPAKQEDNKAHTRLLTEDEVNSRNKAYACAVPHPKIQGFYSNFHSAATVLRIARNLGELDEGVALPGSSVDAFFDLLTIVEEKLMTTRQGSLKKLTYPKPFVIVVEGLDGSGKSTLVSNLTASLSNSVLCSTPTDSMAGVRPVFDKRGGPVARAFYMVSNYVLQHEIRAQDSDKIFVVDRWFSSTCAYSIAWKNTSGGPESIDSLDATLFEWPSDLDPPELMILLEVDDETRRQRVSGRQTNAAYGFNPWDDRLSTDENLGRRIMRAHERTCGPLLVKIDANESKEKVTETAVLAVRNHAKKHRSPVEYFRFQPLEFFRWASSTLNLCDAETGRRKKHAPWAFQLALNSSNQHGYPSLRSVGIHTVDSSGILFFTWGHPGGTMGGCETSASMVCLLGEYPNEQQWRAEGFIVQKTMAECKLLGALPPASLVAQISACNEVVIGDANDSYFPRRETLPGSHAETVNRFRQNPLSESKQEELVLPFQFVPLRMEVLFGGPSSPGGPRRFEWKRRTALAQNGWGKATPILPFNLLVKSPSLVGQTPSLLPVTVAIMGTHCAGKRAVGQRVASIMNWQFDPELGDVLRPQEELVADGHITGDGSGVKNVDNMNWDEYVYTEECKRDGRSSSSRVVETWHVGNLAWALYRKDRSALSVSENAGVLETKARAAIQVESTKRSSVLFVMLKISPETSLRRRKDDKTNAEKKDETNAKRLPMTDEEAECSRLHQALQVRGLDLLETFKEMGIPLLVLNNDKDGQQSLEDTATSIVKMIRLFEWRRRCPL